MEGLKMQFMSHQVAETKKYIIHNMCAYISLRNIFSMMIPFHDFDSRR